jgi:hypothetical protein
MASIITHHLPREKQRFPFPSGRRSKTAQDGALLHDGGIDAFPGMSLGTRPAAGRTLAEAVVRDAQAAEEAQAFARPHHPSITAWSPQRRRKSPRWPTPSLPPMWPRERARLLAKLGRHAPRGAH